MTNPQKSSQQFINQFLSDQSFAVNCTSMLQSKSQDFQTYVCSQGYDLEADDLMNIYKAIALEELKVWAGAYKFKAPNNYTDKILKITIDGKLLINDSEQVITRTADSTFQWQEDTSTVTIKFESHLKDNGSFDPNTFSGTITTPSADGKTITTVGTSGEQQICNSDDDKKWFEYDGFQITNVIVMIVGIPLILKGFYDWFKSCKNPESNPASVSDIRRLNEVQKGIMQKEAQEMLDPDARQTFQQMQEDMFDEFSTEWKDRVSVLSEQPPYKDIQNLDDKAAQITEALKGEASVFVSSKMTDMLNLRLRQKFDQLNNGFYKKMDAILNFKGDAISGQLSIMSTELVKSMMQAEYLTSSAKNCIATNNYHIRTMQAETIIAQQEQAAQTLETTSQEKAKVDEAVSNLNQKLAQPGLTPEDIETIKKELAEQIEKQKDIEIKEASDREALDEITREKNAADEALEESRNEQQETERREQEAKERVHIDV